MSKTLFLTLLFATAAHANPRCTATPDSVFGAPEISIKAPFTLRAGNKSVVFMLGGYYSTNLPMDCSMAQAPTCIFKAYGKSTDDRLFSPGRKMVFDAPIVQKNVVTFSSSSEMSSTSQKVLGDKTLDKIQCCKRGGTPTYQEINNAINGYVAISCPRIKTVSAQSDKKPAVDTEATIKRTDDVSASGQTSKTRKKDAEISN